MTRDEAVAAITIRLVEYYRPELIYLFGSEARGDAGPDSDLDFCVVVPDDAPGELLRDGRIYSLLRGMGYPKDIVVLAPRRFRGPRGARSRFAAGDRDLRRQAAL
jgi:predicted nucleotidyltransferase